MNLSLLRLGTIIIPLCSENRSIELLRRLSHLRENFQSTNHSMSNFLLFSFQNRTRFRGKAYSCSNEYGSFGNF